MASVGKVEVAFNDESLALLHEIRDQLHDIKRRVDALEHSEVLQSDELTQKVAGEITSAIADELCRRNQTLAGGVS